MKTKLTLHENAILNPPSQEDKLANPPSPEVKQATPPSREVKQAIPPSREVKQATPPGPEVKQARHDLRPKDARGTNYWSPQAHSPVREAPNHMGEIPVCCRKEPFPSTHLTLPHCMIPSFPKTADLGAPRKSTWLDRAGEGKKRRSLCPGRDRGEDPSPITSI